MYLIGLLLAVMLLILAYVAQISIHIQYGDYRHLSACTDNLEECRAGEPFIFDSADSLIKQWPKTYAPTATPSQWEGFHQTLCYITPGLITSLQKCLHSLRWMRVYPY
jgi:hypothetical protein